MSDETKELEIEMPERCSGCGQIHTAPSVEEVQLMSLAAHNSVGKTMQEASAAIPKGAQESAFFIRDRMVDLTEIAYVAASWAIELTVEKGWKVARAIFIIKTFIYGAMLPLVIPGFTGICVAMGVLGFEDLTVERMAARGYAVNTWVLSKIAQASRDTVLKLLPEPKKEEPVA